MRGKRSKGCASRSSARWHEEVVTRRLLLPTWIALIALAGCAEERKSYMRHPLVREMKVMPAPQHVPETSTQAEPVAPPRPILPDEKSTLVDIPTIQTPDRTPVPR